MKKEQMQEQQEPAEQQEHKGEENIRINDGDKQGEDSANSSDQPEDTVEADQPEDNAAKLEAAQKEIEELKDKYLRQVAEFDNYRKRTLREKAELILNGGEKVLSALLPVLDDVERAAENIEKSDDVKTLKEGVELILDKLYKTLSSQGLKKMETEGKVFDTDFHEAIALVPAPDEKQKNHVIDCVQPGYMLNEKVLRHAKVVVGQ